jgi:predicted permease
MFDAYVVAGQPTVTDPSALPLTFIRYADAGYFQALQIPLVAGRHFDEILDRRDSPLVAIVDERLARREFGSVANALGKRIRRWRPEGGESAAPSASSMEAAAIARMTSWAEIVGVMGNIRHRADQESSRPTLYYATHQEPADSNFLSVVLRTESHPAALADAARDATLATNRDIPIYYLRPLQETEFRSFWQVRFFTHLFIVFGGVALLLACIGIYGVMSYHVSLRTRELGLRMALGAQAEDVVRMVVQRGLVLVGIGLGTGLVASFSLAQLLAHHLYGVSPHDPPTFAVVPLLLATVAVVACWLPSRRATRIAPASALRAD